MGKISCTGCQRLIEIPFTDHRLIQCRECGKKMHVLTLTPIIERVLLNFNNG